MLYLVGLILFCLWMVVFLFGWINFAFCQSDLILYLVGVILFCIWLLEFLIWPSWFCILLVWFDFVFGWFGLVLYLFGVIWFCIWLVTFFSDFVLYLVGLVLYMFGVADYCRSLLMLLFHLYCWFTGWLLLWQLLSVHFCSFSFGNKNTDLIPSQILMAHTTEICTMLIIWNINTLYHQKYMFPLPTTK